MPVIAIGAGLAALIALLIVLIAGTLAYVASRLIPNFPLIGGAIRSALVSAINAATDTLRGWARGAVVPIGYLFMGIALTIWWALAFVVNVLEHAAFVARYAVNWASHLYAVLYNDLAYASAVLANRITAVYSALIGYANTLYNRAVAVAQFLAGLALSEAISAANAASSLATSLYHDAVGQAVALFNTAEADIRTVEATVANGLSAAAATAERDLAQAISDANAAAKAAEAAAVGAAATATSIAVGGAVGAINAAASDIVNPALHEIETVYGVVVNDLPAELVAGLNLPGTLSGVNIRDLAGALGITVPLVAALTTEVADCVIPQCRNLSGLSGLFHDLTDLAILGGLLALLEEAAHDPNRAATDIGELFGGITNDTASAFRSLIGV